MLSIFFAVNKKSLLRFDLLYSTYHHARISIFSKFFFWFTNLCLYCVLSVLFKWWCTRIYRIFALHRYFLKSFCCFLLLSGSLCFCRFSFTLLQ